MMLVRVYAKRLALLGKTEQFRIDLKPGQRSTFSVDCDYLFKSPRFRYRIGSVTGKGAVSDKREDLTAYTT
ncbi:hypothetical protein DYU11_11495 [Fibrisoma montanum]|uniref:Uncharacterized protein n=2 Tax=Fibrisoma montanum TaxID=2305895 RepID=A0A418MB51_9BACT|nr:hypothetical protein DYU11_11495 [Fibrisoma montanum]